MLFDNYLILVLLVMFNLNLNLFMYLLIYLYCYLLIFGVFVKAVDSYSQTFHILTVYFLPEVSNYLSISLSRQLNETHDLILSKQWPDVILKTFSDLCDLFCFHFKMQKQRPHTQIFVLMFGTRKSCLSCMSEYLYLTMANLHGAVIYTEHQASF